MQDDGHRISAAALRNRGLIRTSGRGTSWTAKLTAAGRAHLARLDAEAGPVDGNRAGERTSRYHPAVRVLRDRRERHEVARVSLTRALQLAQMLATEAERCEWAVRPASESENSYGALDWTGAKDGHLELERDGRVLRLRLYEEGVHARGRWEEQVARFADVAPDSPMQEEAPLPQGDYDARGTGRLKLELQWGPWWTRQQTRWADTAAIKLEECVPDVLAEVERRAAGAARIAAAPPAEERQWVDERPPLASVERAHEQVVDEQLGSVLGDEARRWEEAERLRRYLDAMDRAYGEHPDTAAWIAWGRGHADRLDPLSGRATPPRRPLEPDLEAGA